MNITGRFRLSFNRHGAAPLVWSVSPLDESGAPTIDIAVRAFGLDGVRVVTVYAPKETSDENDGKPSAYLVTEGELSVDESGVAMIKPIVLPLCAHRWSRRAGETIEECLVCDEWRNAPAVTP
jgi:hypothetical protein